MSVDVSGEGCPYLNCKLRRQQNLALKMLELSYQNTRNRNPDGSKILTFLDAFTQLRKATISFVMSVCYSVRLSVPPFDGPHRKFGSHRTNYPVVWYLSVFRKFVGKIQVPLKYDKNIWYFIWRPVYIFIIPLLILLKMRNVSEKLCG